MMANSRAFKALVFSELIVSKRQFISVFFNIVFPSMLLILFGFVFGNQPNAAFGFKGAVDIYLPCFVALSLASIHMMSMVNKLVSEREYGLLKFLRMSPLRPIHFYFSNLIWSVAQLLLAIFTMTALGVIVFHASVPVFWLRFGVAVIVSHALLFAVAFALASLFDRAKSAQAVTTLIFYPLIFLSGAAIPVEFMSSNVRLISCFSPLYWIIQSLTDAWFGNWNAGNIYFFVSAILAIPALVWFGSKRFRWVN